MPMTVAVPPRSQHLPNACSAVAFRPIASKRVVDAAAGQLLDLRRPRRRSAALTRSVAPSCSASLELRVALSTAIDPARAGDAGALDGGEPDAAAADDARPSLPGLRPAAVRNTAPIPVVTPQPIERGPVEGHVVA